MTDYVIDTNVWLMVDKMIAGVKSKAELDCIRGCRSWLRTFVESEEKLVVDVTYRILKEYRENISRQAPDRIKPAANLAT